MLHFTWLKLPFVIHNGVKNTMSTYTLGSSSFVHAPGLIAWAINGAAFPSDRKKMINMVAKGWNIPEEAAAALVLKKVPYTVVENDAVQFHVPTSH
jgi:hypothetical protein